ncbi:hypothetical protein [Actinomyces wuliandei]|uniref:hypothetical protein n=1 Tax=Actinomyces wuliandei TaxID=2057743 RepID=UPI0019D433E3|nr:hypothetical protein [Actinomyces wuliandei]
MGVFGGRVPSVSEMLAEAEGQEPWVASYTPGEPVRHTAASNAAEARPLVAGEDGLALGWRFGVLQTLDDYTSCLRRGGVEFASQVFTQEPPPTGAVEVDAALAALADFLAGRDGWQAPAWVEEPGRVCPRWWYADVPGIFRSEAEAQSPEAFRRRGILITSRSLARA